MATRVLIRSEQKTTFLPPPLPSCGCFMPNIKSFGHTASEEMSFEIVDDDGPTPDHGHPKSSPLSLRLRLAKKKKKYRASEHMYMSEIIFNKIRITVVVYLLKFAARSKQYKHLKCQFFRVSWTRMLYIQSTAEAMIGQSATLFLGKPTYQYFVHIPLAIN